jgi:RNA-directed DNA polymerase
MMCERFKEFALSLNPQKTRLIEFGRLAAENRKRRGLAKPETFNFLGFTFICGKSRRGRFLVERKPRRDRMRAKLRAIKEGLRQRMHHADFRHTLGEVFLNTSMVSAFCL